MRLEFRRVLFRSGDIFALVIMSNGFKISKDFLNDFKFKLIASELETKKGRKKLAQVMVEPFRRSLDYQSIGRKLFMVDPLPEGAPTKYNEKELWKDVKAIRKKNERNSK